MSNHLKILLAFLISGMFIAACSTKREININVTGLRVEYKVESLGVDIAKPRFNWMMEADDRGVMQKSYQILVATDPSRLTEKDQTTLQ